MVCQRVAVFIVTFENDEDINMNSTGLSCVWVLQSQLTKFSSFKVSDNSDYHQFHNLLHNGGNNQYYPLCTQVSSQDPHDHDQIKLSIY